MPCRIERMTDLPYLVLLPPGTGDFRRPAASALRCPNADAILHIIPRRLAGGVLAAVVCRPAPRGPPPARADALGGARAGEGWDLGVPVSYVRGLVERWRTGFDWRATEARLNAHPQFVTTVDGERVHLIHQPSPEPGAVPLLMLHGWPGSVLEFLPVLGPSSSGA